MNTQLVCDILKLFSTHLQCPQAPPPPSDGYRQTFANLTGATQAVDYMTYGLVDTVDGKTADILSFYPHLTPP